MRVPHRLCQPRSQSHPRHLAGFLTVPQIAGALEVPVHWIDDHLHRGTMAITKDPTTKLYVFPDRLPTLKLFNALQSGKRRHIQFHERRRRGSRAPEAAVIR